MLWSKLYGAFGAVQPDDTVLEYMSTLTAHVIAHNFVPFDEIQHCDPQN
jgi:hypothetical protein